MPKKITVRVFISHAASDGEFAKPLKRLIHRALRIPKEAVFLTSDSYSLRGGKKEEEQITAAHKECKVVVALLTPQSVFRPWVESETGGAHFQNDKPLFLALGRGCTFGIVPEPMRFWHAHSLTKLEQVKALCRGIASELGKKVPQFPTKELKQVVELASRGEGNWETVCSVAAAEKTVTSPYNSLNILYDDTFQGAKHEIHFIGQNLITLVRKDFLPDFRERLFAWLKKKVNGKPRKAHILIIDQDDRALVTAFESMYSSKGVDELRNSTEAFASWARSAKRKGLKLEFRVVSRLFPPRMMFVDPNSDSGYVVLPAFVIKSTSPDRPQFIVHKRQSRTIFDYYWLHYFDEIRRCSRVYPLKA